MNFQSACFLSSPMKSQNHFIEECSVLEARIFLCNLYILYENVAGYDSIAGGDFLFIILRLKRKTYQLKYYRLL